MNAVIDPIATAEANVDFLGQIIDAYRREGFEAANADKIFESTYSSQTQRN